MGGQARRRKRLLDELKRVRIHSAMKEEILHCALWRTSFGRGFGPVVRQTS